jgi:hypothetical protein
MIWNGSYSGHAYCFNGSCRPYYSWKRGNLDIETVLEDGEKRFRLCFDDRIVEFSGNVIHDCLETKHFSSDKYMIRAKLIGSNNEITGKVSVAPVVLEDQLSKLWEVQVHLYKS